MLTRNGQWELDAEGYLCLLYTSLLVAMIVGLVIAILQAATQVHEQTLSFAPKAVAVGLALFILAPWMTSECIDFVNFIFEKVSAVPIT